MHTTRAIMTGAGALIVAAGLVPVQAAAQTPGYTPAPVPAASAPDVRLAPPRLYGSLEYLLWSVKDAPLAVPLLSTGPFTEPDRGGFSRTPTPRSSMARRNRPLRAARTPRASPCSPARG